ncbi:MAG: thioredoxin-disulfide reductase [bacterium]
MLQLKMMKQEEKVKEKYFDLVIIGGGPAGLTAGIYAGRARLKTVIIEEMIAGGQSATTEHLENYPGFKDGVGGVELAMIMEEQAKRFGTEVIYDKVVSVKLSSEEKEVYLSSSVIKAKTVIIASGAIPRRLKIDGADKFHGKGISYCATCDGALFRDKRILIVGAGNSAVEEGIFMQRFTSDITFVQDLPYLTAEKILQERIKSYPKTKFYLGTLVKSINGKENVESVTLKVTKDNSEITIPADGVFVYIGYNPKTEFLGGEVKLNDQGYIITNDDLKTNIDGVYAAGDVRVKDFRQVITAASDGAIAAHSAEKYLENK